MNVTGEFIGWFLLALVIISGWVILRFFRAPFLPLKPEQNWLGVEGTAYICRVNVWKDSNGEELSEPVIRCVYQVNHVTYTLTLHGLGSWNCTRLEWENVGRYYPKQYTVRVRYDPQNPRRAVVEPTRSSSSVNG